MSHSRLVFPTDPPRPQHTGRGETLEKNREKAHKAQETHQKNVATAAPRPPSTPAGTQNFPSQPSSTPNLAQHHIPETVTPVFPRTPLLPLDPAHPPSTPAGTQNFPPQPLLAQRHIPETSAPIFLRTPLLPLDPQQSVWPSPFSSQAPPTGIAYTQAEASPLQAVTQSAQPEYADFGPLQNHSFGTMLASMSEDQIGQMAAWINMLFTDFRHHRSGPSQSTAYTGGSEERPSSPSPGGRPSSPLPSGGGDGGDGEQDGDDDVHPEKPWNNPDMEQFDEEEELDVHSNAKSSLEVTMQDVDVQKPGKRKRGKGGSENQFARKKRRGRTQTSRSIKEIAAPRQRIVKATFPFIQKCVATRIPWPAGSPSGDPTADDDDFAAIMDYSWDAGIASLHLDPTDFKDRTEEEDKLMRSRISQVRGSLMTAVDALLPTTYGFVHLETFADPTPEKITETLEANRKLVDDLAGRFMFADPKQPIDISTMCRHPIFQKLLNIVLFAKKGLNRRSFYFDGMDLLPLETLGLMMDAMICGIDRWKTREHVVVDFSAEVYTPIHENSMKFLEAWVKEYVSELRPVDLAAELRSQMLTKARGLSKAPAEAAPIRREMFPMDLFSQT
ncbi:hypothetical protein DFH07DRAFT_938778 [Mycena maculata]|uniref:DUF6532 domain-containing protein n=1 Tax=Mycena maculata TaxID=230809 RepID=A0AAD7JMJ7_9AGAR|nr:hypothetical protein DFH07DRAFT_938778 [Mycena maculata]